MCLDEPHNRAAEGEQITEDSADYDAIVVSAHCLLDKLPSMLEILADVVPHPAFAKDAIERMR